MGHFFLSQCTCYVVKGRALGVHQGRATHTCALWRCLWGRVWVGTMPLALLSAGFQSLSRLPTSKLAPSGADSQVGGFVYVLGPSGCFQWTLLWGWEFLPLPQPPQVFSVRDSEALFPRAGTLGWGVCLSPQLFLLVYLHANVGPPAPPVTTPSAPPAIALPWVLSALAAHLHPSYRSGWVFLL